MPRNTLPNFGSSSSSLSSSREVLTTNRVYYVRSDGNDSNTGLLDTPSSAFATIQKAVRVVAGLDLGPNNVSIFVSPGTYFSVPLLPLTGNGTVSIVGTSLGGCILQGNPGTAAFSAAGANCRYSIGNFTLATSRGISSSDNAQVTIVNNMFYECSNRIFDISSGGTVSVTSGFTINNSMLYFASVITGGSLRISSGVTCTLTTSHTFTSFILARDSGSNVSIAGASFPGSAFGQKYNVSLNASIYANGVVLPGDVAGVLQTGGQYT